LNKSRFLLKIDSLLVSLLSCLLQGFLHGGELLNLARTFRFLDSFNLNNKRFVLLFLGLEIVNVWGLFVLHNFEGFGVRYKP
jgi:hypothetical protein